MSCRWFATFEDAFYLFCPFLIQAWMASTIQATGWKRSAWIFLVWLRREKTERQKQKNSRLQCKSKGMRIPGLTNPRRPWLGEYKINVRSWNCLREETKSGFSLEARQPLWECTLSLKTGCGFQALPTPKRSGFNLLEFQVIHQRTTFSWKAHDSQYTYLNHQGNEKPVTSMRQTVCQAQIIHRVQAGPWLQTWLEVAS